MSAEGEAYTVRSGESPGDRPFVRSAVRHDAKRFQEPRRPLKERVEFEASGPQKHRERTASYIERDDAEAFVRGHEVGVLSNWEEDSLRSRLVGWTGILYLARRGHVDLKAGVSAHIDRHGNGSLQVLVPLEPLDQRIGCRLQQAGVGPSAGAAYTT